MSCFIFFHIGVTQRIVVRKQTRVIFNIKTCWLERHHFDGNKDFEQINVLNQNYLLSAERVSCKKQKTETDFPRLCCVQDYFDCAVLLVFVICKPKDPTAPPCPAAPHRTLGGGGNNSSSCWHMVTAGSLSNHCDPQAARLPLCNVSRPNSRRHPEASWPRHRGEWSCIIPLVIPHFH